MSTDDPFKYFRVEAAELMETLYAQLRGLTPGQDSTKNLQELKRAAHSLKGAARLMELLEIGDIAHALEDIFSDPKQGQILSDPQAQVAIVGMLDKIQDKLELALSPATRLENEQVKPPVETALEHVKRDIVATDSSQSKRVSSSDITRVDSAILDEITRGAADVMELGEQSGNWMKLVKRSESITKELSRELGGDVPKIGELSETLDALQKELGSGTERLAPVGKALHRMAIDTKLVMVEEDVHRFEKIVRDTCRELGKQVAFQVTGVDLKVDRHILQRLHEPLAHLLRNSVFHGIEDSAKRLELGKNGVGQVELAFERIGENIRITLTDDGSGLNRENIKKAVERAGGRVADNVEAGELIWGEGVSTAQNVTLIAGRGVGLSVVRQAVENLGGKANVDFEEGRWCRFSLEVPSSLDVLDVFVIKDNGNRFLIPLSSVSELRVLLPEHIVDYNGKASLIIEDKPVRLLSLERHASNTKGNSDHPHRSAIIIRDANRVFGLVVAQVLGKQRVVVKALDESLKRSSLVAGAAIMSDGDPAFVLSPAGILAELADLPAPTRSAAADVALRKQPVLVVDDSLTTRMLEKAILESAGYEATLARDGQEALKVLQEKSFDLIIVDFEMPNLDGMELTRTLRTMDLHVDTPIIMLTSRGSDEDKRRGLQAGVQAYLVKGRFDQNEFLSTVRGLLGVAS